MSHTLGNIRACLAVLRIIKTYADNFVLRSCRKVLAIRAKAHAADIEIAIFRQSRVLKNRDAMSGLDVEDLSGSVAAGGNKSTIETKAHTAYHALVVKGMDKIHIKHTLYSGIENGEPIVTFAFEMWWESVRVKIAKAVANVHGIWRRL